MVGLPDTGTVPEMRGRLQENLEKCLMVEIIHIGCACGSGTSAGGEARRVPEQERSSPIVKMNLFLDDFHKSTRVVLAAHDEARSALTGLIVT